VLHTELFLTCEPTPRVASAWMWVINGLHRAPVCGREAGWAPERPLIMCFLRHLSEEEAFETADAVSDKDHVGLDSVKWANPRKFAGV
jgi:adenosine deaminase